MAPRSRKCSTSAVPRAPPSAGSVPVPTSSRITRAGSSSSRPFARKARARGDLRNQKRMAGLGKPELALLGEEGGFSAADFGESAFGLRQIDLREYFDRESDVVPARSHPLRELREDLPNLFALSIANDGDVVIDLDGRQRLDEKRRAARGSSVHDPGKLRSALGLDGYDGAVISRSDQAFLEELLVVARGERVIEELSQLGLEPSRSLANPLELAAGIVPNGLRLEIDDSPNVGLDRLEAGKDLGPRREKRRLARPREEGASSLEDDGARDREPEGALDSEDPAPHSHPPKLPLP